MNHYLLIYHLAPGYLERRGALRDAHLEHAWRACERGEMLLAGAIENPLDTAMLLFAGEGPAVAEAFAVADPYVKEGLVERWNVRRWMTVAGEGAASPLRPGVEGL